MAPYSRNFAKPFSACLFVIAAVRVVYGLVRGCEMGGQELDYFAVINVANCTCLGQYRLH